MSNRQPATSADDETGELNRAAPRPRSAYRQVTALITSLTLIQAALSCLTLIIILRLRENGASNFEMGLVGSAFATGLFLGATNAPRQIQRIGNIRAFVFFAAAAIVVALAYTLPFNVFVWAAFQTMIGFCFSGLWAAGEGWIARAAPVDKRGALVSFYHLVNKLGSISGPFMAAALPDRTDGFMLVGALLALAILPIAMTSTPQPVATSTRPFSPMRIIRIAPAAAWGAFTSGVINTGVGQLYPVYVRSLDTDTPIALAAQFNAALLVGVMLALWPAGLLSDRIDRRIVIGGAGILGSVAAWVLAFFGHHLPIPVFLAVVMIYGAGALSHYAIDVAHAADKADPTETSGVVAGILMIWSAGSVLGPIIAGAVMNTSLGPAGLFMFSGAGLALLSLVMVVRTTAAAPVPQEDKEDFTPMQTTSLAFVDITPRGDDEQLDLFLDGTEPGPAEGTSTHPVR